MLDKGDEGGGGGRREVATSIITVGMGSEGLGGGKVALIWGWMGGCVAMGRVGYGGGRGGGETGESHAVALS